MNTQRKTTSTKTAAKKPSTASSTKSTASAAETVVNMNNKAIADIQTSISTEAQKAQEQFYAIGQQSAEQIAKTADTAGEAINEASNICRDNMEACIESGNIAANIAREISEELTEYSSHAANEAVELSKEFFACRTLNDVVELQNKVMKNSVENSFEQWSRLSNSAFESFNEIFEPINQRIAESTEQISKLMKTK